MRDQVENYLGECEVVTDLSAFLWTWDMYDRTTSREYFSIIFHVSLTPFSFAAICALPDMATGTTKLDTPVSIAFKTVRDRRLTGKLTSFDEKGFTYLNFLDQARQVKWDDVDAKTDYLIHKKIMPKDDAKAA